MRNKSLIPWILAGLAGVVLVGCAPANPLPSSPPSAPGITPPPSSTATITSTALPSPTLTPTLPYFGDGMLSLEQKQRLAESSLQFVADTEADAIRVSRSIKYLVNEGHPASVCGPLSIAILQNAGLLDPAVDRHLFWKLNPRPDADLPLLEETFPRSRYEWISVRTPIDTYDFSAHPLQPGDFLYLYAGDAGSFEHMLVVTRVDEAGRAFSVTNLNTVQGYLIQELLLYDPTQPGRGAFYDWTALQNWQLGLTGFGGFDLWRLSQPTAEPSPAESDLRLAVESVIQAVGGKWNVYLKEIGGAVRYSRLENEALHPASTIKLPIAMLFFQTLQELGVTDPQSYIDTHAIDSRPVSELLRSMLVFSDESATEILMHWSVTRTNYETIFNAWNITHTMLTPRRSTAAEIARFMEVLYTGEALSPDARTIILSLLAERTANDALRLGGLQDLLGSDGTVYNKRGTLTADWLIVADSAIITYKEKAYVLVVIAQPEVDQSTPTYEQLEEAFAQIVQPLWSFLQSDQAQ